MALGHSGVDAESGYLVDLSVYSHDKLPPKGHS